MYEAEYVSFLNISNSSSSETSYLSNVSGRLGFMPLDVATALEREYEELCSGLNALINSYRHGRGR